ncbi:hypothetical protein VNO78_10714 [Psophocarpus tetragonolobus]|uniref:Uncharacterized protein n=1 Tax=Psophocarpus tetragonolobus TaxID=3891 RepID=A0AAN9SRW7_PSOTE
MKVKLLVWHRVRESIWLNEELESTQKEMFDGRNNIDIWNRDTNMAPTFDNAQLLICVGRRAMQQLLDTLQATGYRPRPHGCPCDPRCPGIGEQSNDAVLSIGH